MVSWQPPPPIDHNGPITGYVIQYNRSDGLSGPMNMSVSNVASYTISGLDAYVNYSVRVSARTVNATGPFSNTEVGTSGEDSELLCM